MFLLHIHCFFCRHLKLPDSAVFRLSGVIEDDERNSPKTFVYQIYSNCRNVYAKVILINIAKLSDGVL